MDKVEEARHDQRESDESERGSRRWARRAVRWRESVRSCPSTNRLYRLAVGLLGGAIVVVGLALVPLPGPGWVIVFVGLAALATEFVWAARLEQFARKQVSVWTIWILAQPLYVRAAVALGTSALAVACFWITFLVIGVPGWVPADLIPAWTGLESRR
ncbi:hypothetical protein LWF15_18205 [Kineosporia rhizophila]|uniref:PGPGW domain-containing protein n=1 Tax=Kineosporia rhizophila TaxID=84633 RepID=UPI001E5FEE84|nr:PGPGW domain-containing protein [Kineosporia rhizophila]MCE0537433.1 hypothetical protein [Kineosporia rhizophila]